MITTDILEFLHAKITLGSMSKQLCSEKPEVRNPAKPPAAFRDFAVNGEMRDFLGRPFQPGAANPSPEPANKRREGRLPCVPTSALVRVEGRPEPAQAAVRDVSKSGLRLILREPIPIGSGVTVQLPDMVVTGEIRFCVPTEENSFNAGLKISDAIKTHGCPPAV